MVDLIVQAALEKSWFRDLLFSAVAEVQAKQSSGEPERHPQIHKTEDPMRHHLREHDDLAGVHRDGKRNLNRGATLKIRLDLDEILPNSLPA